MALDYGAVRLALRARLATLTVLATLPRAWEGHDFTRPTGQAWLGETLLPGPAERIALGNPGARVRNFASYQMSLFVPFTRQTRDDTLRDQLVTHFWPGLQLTHSGQVITIRRTSPAAPVPEAGWRQLPVTIAVEFDTRNPT